MSAQFFRVETAPLVRSRAQSKFSRPALKNEKRWSLPQLVDELIRAPDACTHIANPQAPIPVFGCAPEALLGEVIRRRDEHLAKYPRKRGRVNRKDTHIAFNGVASYPIPTAEVNADSAKKETYLTWEAAAIEYIENSMRSHGAELLCVVRHEDEDHLHIHFYAIPTASQVFDARELHPAWIAKRAELPVGGLKRANAAYSRAMSKWQDDFWINVSARFGHERFSDKRERVPRAVANKMKIEKKAIKDAHSVASAEEKRATALRQEAEAKATENLDKQKRLDTLLSEAEEAKRSALEAADAQAMETKRLRQVQARYSSALQQIVPSLKRTMDDLSHMLDEQFNQVAMLNPPRTDRERRYLELLEQSRAANSEALDSLKAILDPSASGEALDTQDDLAMKGPFDV